MTGTRWHQVWEARQLSDEHATTLAGLMQADGLDTGFGDVSADAWSVFVQSIIDRLGVRPGQSVYEVGCGAGAFLYEFDQAGAAVAGLDYSNALITIARQAMPWGNFAVAEAAALDVHPLADFVVSCGVFLYFDTLEYATRVIGKMAAKARIGVAVLDVPDLDLRDRAMASRVATVGGPEAYRARYKGLDHLYYRRDWIREAFERAGLYEITVEDQEVAGYDNGAFRFNAFGIK